MRGFDYARAIAVVCGRSLPVVDSETGEFVRAFSGARLPEYFTERSAGVDFFCAEEVVIPSFCGSEGNAPVLVHTGVKAFMEDDEVLELYNRSSNPLKRGLVLANSVGIVDADYYNNPANDGEIMFAFYNFSDSPVKLCVGDRIGQGIFKKFLRAEEGYTLKRQERSGGFGSTGN